MKTLILLKLILLTVALVFVVWVMRSVNANSVARFFTNLGAEPGAQVTKPQSASPVAVESGESFNLCRTRIHALIWPDGRRVEESVNGLKMKWMAHDPSPREVSYLDMEKWLSQHCQVAVKPHQLAEGETLGFSDYLTVKFIDGESAVIQQAETGGYFRIGLKVFSSEDLRSAIAEIRGIAQFKDDGSGPKAP